MYTPQNDSFFTAAYSGALAGMVSGRGISNPDPVSYLDAASVAGAFAQRIDTLWATRSTNGLDLDLVMQACEAVWQDRSAEANSSTLDPTSYTQLSNAVIALLTAGENYFNTNSIPFPSSFNFASWNVGAWFIDPVGGNNNNDGLTDLTPIKTWLELVRRWGTIAPLLAQDTTVTFLNDQPDLSDPVAVIGQQGQGSGSLLIKGSLTALPGGSGTFSEVDARNRATGAKWTVQDLSKPANFWAAFVGCLVHDTTANAFFWVEEDIGGSSARVSEPLTSSVDNPVPDYVAIVATDNYVILKPTKVNVVRFGINTNSGNASELRQLWIFGSGQSLSVDTSESLLTECRVDSFTNFEFGNLANCYAFGLEMAGGFIAGGVITTILAVVGVAEVVIDGDCIVNASGGTLGIEGTLVVGAAFFAAGGTDVPSVNNAGASNGQLYVSDGALYGTAAFWGPASLAVHVGGDLGYTGLATPALLNTGGITLDGVGTASSYDLVTGIWTPGIAVTKAKLDAAVAGAGGGFGQVAYGVRGTKIRQIA